MEAEELTLEQIDLAQRQLEREIAELRARVDANDKDTAHAHKRIDALEQRLSDISAAIALATESIADIKKHVGDLRTEVAEFSPKQDRFMKNMWRLIFMLVVALAGLTGIKLFIPSF